MGWKNHARPDRGERGVYLARGIGHGREEWETDDHSMRIAAALLVTLLSDGVTAFEQRHWHEAMQSFLNVLTQDPQNGKAHSYINLIAQEISSERRAAVREKRLALLAQ